MGRQCGAFLVVVEFLAKNRRLKINTILIFGWVLSISAQFSSLIAIVRASFTNEGQIASQLNSGYF